MSLSRYSNLETYNFKFYVIKFLAAIGQCPSVGRSDGQSVGRMVHNRRVSKFECNECNVMNECNMMNLM